MARALAVVGVTFAQKYLFVVKGSHSN